MLIEDCTNMYNFTKKSSRFESNISRISLLLFPRFFILSAMLISSLHIFFTLDKNNSCTKVHTVERATRFALKLSNEAENLIRSITRIAMANTGS